MTPTCSDPQSTPRVDEATDADETVSPHDCDHPVSCRYGKLGLYSGDTSYDDHIKCGKCGGTISP